MSATFRQEIRTPLLLEPLRSRGRLLYRQRPACLLFVLEEPRATRVRFDATSYQVHQVKERRAERFLFSRDDLAGALVKVFGSDVQKLEQSFRLTGFEREAERATILLAPESKAFRAFMTSLALVFSRERDLESIRYRNAEGDEVEIVLSQFDRKAEIAPTEFSGDLPEGTELKTHVVKH